MIGDHPLQHRLEQSSVALDSSDLLGALRACLAGQDPVLGECTGKNTAVVDATIATQGLRPNGPASLQADEAVQALSARRRTMSLSQHYLLKDCAQVENVQEHGRFVGNVLDLQDIDTEVSTET